MCTDSKFGFEENSEYIIFNFKKEYVRKIEVIFKTQIGRNQIAIGDLQIFYTETDAVIETIAPSCVEAQIVDEKFEEIDIKVLPCLRSDALISRRIWGDFNDILVGDERKLSLQSTMSTWLLPVRLWSKRFLLFF